MTPATELRVRRGGPADAALLSALAARTFSEAFGPDNRMEDMSAHLAAAYGVPQQSRELSHPDWITLLIEAEADLVAYAQVRRHQAPLCVTTAAPIELHRFYVDRPWQGRGAAQQLMQAVRLAARELGGESLWLSVWERNPRAIAFYGKCGFGDAGSADFFVGRDRQTDRIMVARLEAP